MANVCSVDVTSLANVTCMNPQIARAFFVDIDDDDDDDDDDDEDGIATWKRAVCGHVGSAVSSDESRAPLLSPLLGD